MLTGVVLTLAAWGLSPPTSTPCLCQGLSHLLRSQSHLSVSPRSPFLCLSGASQPGSLTAGEGAAAGPAQAPSGEERQQEPLSSHSPWKRRREALVEMPSPHPSPTPGASSWLLGPRPPLQFTGRKKTHRPQPVPSASHTLAGIER